MSRLLHAAARKARIQRLMQCPHRWENYQLVAPLRASDEDRIHPDDAHLQYGPVSTALREIALTGDYEDSTIPYFTFGIEREDNYWSSTEDQRRVFCLILAEFLADEGM